jgi:hypothetical protein
MPSFIHKTSPIALSGKRRRVWTLGLLVFVACLLPLLSGCDWRFAENVRKGTALDLSGYGSDDGTWRLRRGDSAVWSQPCDTSGDSCRLEMAVSGGRSATLRRKVRWDAEGNPILKWSWSLPTKVDSLPIGRSRVGQAQTDAVVALDVTLASSFGFEKTVRYVWSARHDRGRTLSADNWRPKALVLRDARDMGKTVTDSVNVWEDFRKTFGYTPRHLALSVAVSVRSNRPGKPVAVRFGPILALPEAK